MAEATAGYARAFFEVAQAEGRVERVEDELLSVAQAFDGSAELRSALTNPELPLERKQAVVDDILERRVSGLTLGLIQFAVSQGRADDLGDIARQMAEASAASRDRALAEVRSAVPLDDSTVERLSRALGQATGKDVEVKVIIDESVIGGLVARVGDTVIDGSIAGRVEELRQVVNTR